MAGKGKHRTPEQKEQLLEIVQMRMDGYTIQEIADKYGVTKQCIQERLSILANGYRPRVKGIDEKIIYPNLAKWISDNRIVKYKLSHMIGLSENNMVTTAINKRLYGETDFSMSEIKMLLKATNDTFEHLFAEKETDGESE